MGTAIRQKRQKKGPKGAGRVTIQKSGSAKIYLGDNVIDIAQQDVPEKIGNWKFVAVGTPTKPVFVELSVDETRIVNVRHFWETFLLNFLDWQLGKTSHQLSCLFPNGSPKDSSGRSVHTRNSIPSLRSSIMKTLLE